MKKYNFNPDMTGQFMSAASMGKQQYIGIAKAKQIALSHAGFRPSQVYFTKQKFDMEDGVAVYKLEFIKGRLEYEYEIDAVTGMIREWDREIND